MFHLDFFPPSLTWTDGVLKFFFVLFIKLFLGYHLSTDTLRKPNFVFYI